jgi:hypothetical protein
MGEIDESSSESSLKWPRDGIEERVEEAPLTELSLSLLSLYQF